MSALAVYPLVWLLYLVLLSVFLFFFWRLLAFVSTGLVSELIWVTMALLLLLPASIPSHDAYYAPAVIIIFFETFFQQSGFPDGVAFLLLGFLIVGWVAVFMRRWRTWF